MALTTSGADAITNMLIGSGTAFNNANAHIGVGDGTTVFDPAQTDLQGTSKFRAPMEAGFPNISGNTISFRCLIGTADANFNWAEWGVFNAASGGTMLNRKVQDLGTKSSYQSWQLTVSITINAA